MDCSLPGFSVGGIFQARIQESGLPCPSLGDLPNPGIEPMSLTSPALAGGFFNTGATWEALKWPSESQICQKYRSLLSPPANLAPLVHWKTNQPFGGTLIIEADVRVCISNMQCFFSHYPLWSDE